MKYFEKFPFINYPYYGKLTEQVEDTTLIDFVTTIDLNVRFTIQNSITNNTNSFYTYNWQDGDTPDLVAYHYYGSHYYDWLVMISNNAFDWLYDLPMKQSVLESYIESKYEIDIIESFTTVLHYEDINGYIIDEKTYLETAGSSKKVYIYDYEHEQNEYKREVKLVSRDYLQQIDRELDDKLTTIRNHRELNARY